MGLPHQPLPSGPIDRCRGGGVALVGDDIDTDRIIPARFLKCVTFDDLATGVFADDRAELGGDHPFDRAASRGARLLLVNRNFGCGSSREHAPQALMRWGIRAVIGESFAEIFFGNCLALGIPCLTAAHDDIAAIQSALADDPAATLEADLTHLELRFEPSPGGPAAGEGPLVWPLQLAPGPHRMLLSGQWDGTAQLMAHDAHLRATADRLPYLNAFVSGSPAHRS